jgi:hypothetical protein
VRIRVPNIEPRPYQVGAFEYWDSLDPGQPGRAVEIWARRMGKDLCYMNIAHMKSLERKGLYLHMLPEFAHARRTLWDGFSNEGDRLIDLAFPPALRASINEQEMRIELRSGAVWQLGGSDQYDRWVGSNPIWIVFSEFALANPKGWDIMRPILRHNGGHAAFITTPRGYNHAHQVLELAKREATWRHSVQNAVEVGLMTMEDIATEIRLGMPEELARQEYLCDFSAANVGAILGKYVEAAEKDGRIGGTNYDHGGGPIHVSSDIGFRDTAAFWWWQLKPGGFSLIHYEEGTGRDAEEWISELEKLPYDIDTFWLPHDARAKTFQSRHTVIEQFTQSGLADNYKLVPAMKPQDKINAGRSVLPRCDFDQVNCAQGLLGLRDWSFKWDDDKKTYSREPDHNWASHPADAFCYGASMLRDFVAPSKPKPKPQQASASFTLDALFTDNERPTGGYHGRV